MAKQGNSDKGRKRASKSPATPRSGKSSSADDRPVTGATPVPPKPTAGRQRRRAAGAPSPAASGSAGKPSAPQGKPGRRPASRREAETDAKAREQSALPQETEAMLPVEVVDAASPPTRQADVGAPGPQPGRRARERAGPRSNALGGLIERRFSDPSSPVRSYSELERRSHISREALSRYVTPRADRRRSPTIDTLAAIAEAMHLSLEQVCRAAVAGAHGEDLPEETVLQARDELIGPLIAPLNEDQFSALIELLRQMQRRPESE